MSTITYYSLSQKGTGHKVNEDSVLNPFEVCDGVYLAGVFDGISGNGGGEHASSRAANQIKELAEDVIIVAVNYRDALIKLAILANQAILNLQQEVSGKMGTTMTLCLIDTITDTLHVAHIGDSVLFRILGESATRLTAEDNDSSGCLTKWLGQPWPLDMDSLYFKCGIEDGTQLILGSDGFVRHRSIQDYLPIITGNAPDQIVNDMVHLAQFSSTDDISILYIDYHGSAIVGEEPNNGPDPIGVYSGRAPVIVPNNTSDSDHARFSFPWWVTLLLVSFAFLAGLSASPTRRTAEERYPVKHSTLDSATDATNTLDTIKSNNYELEPQN
jgi:serine/threonine protein phosphatase PrpC